MTLIFRLAVVTRYLITSLLRGQVDVQRLMEVLGSLSFALRVLVELVRLRERRKRGGKRAHLRKSVEPTPPADTD